MKHVPRLRSDIAAGRINRELPNFDEAVFGREHHFGTIEFVNQFRSTVAAALFLMEPRLNAQAPPRQSGIDPVLDGILNDFRELKYEGDTKPNQRQAATRAAESLSGVLAAHLGMNYDANVKRGLRRAIERHGRAAFIQDQVSRLPNARHEDYDKFLTRFEQAGFEGVFKDGQKALKKLREQNPNFQRVAFGATTVQYDFCQDLNWIIDLLSWAILLCVSLAVLEPTFVGEIPCAAMGIALAAYEAMRWWWC